MKKILAQINDTGVKQSAAEMPILNFPTDYPRPRMQSYEANLVKFELGQEETLSLKMLTSDQGVTLYTILLAVCNIWLSKLSGQEDIIIGTPIAGRVGDLQHNNRGALENTLALRNFPAAKKTVIDFFKEVNERTFAAFQQQNYDFVEKLEKFVLYRDDSRNHLFDLKIEFFDNYDRLVFNLQHSTKLFKEETAQRFAGYFKNIINSIIENPEIRISAVEIMGPEEKTRMLELATGIVEPCDPFETIHGMFEKAAAENEAKIALVFRDSQMSYGKLNHATNRLARMLRYKGVGPDRVVGLMVERSFYLVIGVLGILKAGGGYLPIDPNLPGQRKRFMLQDSDVKILLAGAETKDEIFYNPTHMEQININDESLYRGNDQNPVHINKGSDLLYVIFTSGSTGRPKGVMLEHTNLVNLITFHYKYTDIDCIKVLQFVTMSFDVCYQEIFTALLDGGQLYLIDEEIRINIPTLFEIIEKNKIKTLFLPMSFLKMIFNQEGYVERFPRSVRHIITAGEQAVVNERFGRYLKENNIYFYNHYGPSETHVITTFTMYPWQETLEFPPIGKPIMNTMIYILDLGGYIQPVGVAGELVAGGLQVGRGYLNNPELAAERFVKNRFHRSYKTYILYKTGDLSRWLGSGDIEFLGRIDQQVKIRGFRVELGEIENELVKHQDIKDAVVVPQEDEIGDKYLCVYYVPHQPNTVKVEELTAHLSKSLPGYMVPMHFIVLEKIPLTASGKVDRKALPRPDQLETANIYAAAGNKIEEKLVELWSEVLGIQQEKIGVDHNFFHLGGQSLKAAMLISKIHSVFNVNLPLVEVFESPTIKAQGRYIKEAEVIRYSAIEPVEKKEYYDLSPAQKRLFIMHQMEAPYNMGSAWGLKGQLDKNRVEETVRQLIHRHESLRTSFLTVENEPVQKIHDAVKFQIEYDELATDKRCPGQTRTLLPMDFLRPFDLSCAPLLRARLSRTGENEYVFMVDIHHIVSDGLSLGIFMKEFMELYQVRTLPLLQLQYKDYCQWLKQQRQQGALGKQEEYWQKVFSAEVPVLELPYDYPRPTFQSFEGRIVFLHLDSEETEGLKRFISVGKSSTTLYMVLLALFNVLLAKLSGNEDIAVGTPVHGRNHMDVQPIIGMFVGTLAMRFNPVPGKTIEQFIREVKKHSLAAFENQDYPFEDLVEKVVVNRDTSRNPLFDVMFAVQDSEIFPGIEVEGLSVKSYEYDNGTAYFDLFWEVIEKLDILTFALHYCTKLFEEDTLKRFFRYFRRIVSAAVENPGRKIGEIEIITGEEKREILYDFNDTQSDYPRDKTIQWLFEEQVVRTPDNIALTGAALFVRPVGHVSLSYRQLHEQSDCLAHLLIEKGVLADNIVGIMMERSVEMIIGILGILKCGGAYLSIDPAYPQERIDYMLKESGAKIMIGIAEERNSGRAGFVISSYFPVSPLLRFLASDSSNLAYVIYTSGSTGKPKGVMVEHRNVVRLVKNSNYVEFNVNDRLLQTGALEFDASTFEIWGSLLNGMTLYILAKDDILDPQRLKSFIKRYDICTMWLTSPLFNRMVQWDVEIFSGLRYLLVGGDILSPSHINQVRNRFPGVEIINGYGPTENTTFSTTYRIDKQYENRIPIGKPIANSTAYIVDRTGRLAPVGIAGELWVGGDGISRGYLNNPELTSEKFNRSYMSHKTYICYKTGDLARWLGNGPLAGGSTKGVIEFLGRIDQQVKIRGFRVESGEIENELKKHKDIKDAVVIPQEDKTGDKYLCAYYVSHHSITLRGEELSGYLARYLPGYMVPMHYVALEKIPLNANGKIDRKALPRPGILEVEGNYVAPRGEMEEKLVELWSLVLGVEREKIGMNQNFFHLGGHSLKLFMLTALIHKKFDVKAPMSKFFEITSLRGQIEYIKTAAPDKYNAIEPVEKKEYYDLSPAQKRLLIMHQMGAAYNLDSVWRIKGQLDKYRLDETFHQLIRRHESLRTSFHMMESNPVQKIQSDVIFKIDCYDLGPGDREIERKIEKTLQDFVRPFDLSCAPLLRAGLIPLRENEHIFMLDIHHIISDGLSLGIFIKEFMELYKGYPLPELRLQYKDYCQWRNREQQQGILDKQEGYWLKRYEGEVPALELPYDYPRPIFQSFEGGMVFFRLDREETAVLKHFVSDDSNVLTLYMVLLALFNVLLAKLSGNEDIVVGTPVHGRKHIDFQPIIGMFVGTLAMRNYPSPGKTITQFIQEVKENSLSALENQDYPFEDLVEKVVVERDTSRNPLFDVMFALQESEIVTSFELEGLSVESYEHESRVAYFDLFWEVIERAGALNFILYYCKKLFKIETLNRFFNYFKAIVFAAIENPQKKIGEIEIITEEEKRKVLNDFNNTEADYPQGKTIHSLYEEQVERIPHNTAVVGAVPVAGGGLIYLTYRKLNEISTHLAGLLQEKGACPDTIVGLMIERSIDLIISILGILKSGAAYLPIDPGYPQERIDYMLKDSGAKLLAVANNQEGEKVRGWEGKTVLLEELSKSPKVSSYNLTLLPSYPLNSSNLAYIIYTSGSTGTPKGVMVEHHSVVNVLFSLFHTYPILPIDSLLVKTSFLFDVSIAELFTWFLGGSRLIVPGKDDHKDPQTLLDIIERETVTHINFVPSMFGVFISQLNRENIKKLSGLKYIFLAGEALPPEQVAVFRELNNKIVMENLYGPTENTVYTTQYSLSGWSGKGSVPIGKPLSNMQLYVLDWNYCLQPIGISGELCISGIGLARGYLNRPELTSNKFMPINRSFWRCRNLFEKRFLPAGGILYHTGDLARWMTDGNIEFLGRIDQQVKIRGYRIELGEIENRLRSHESIKDAIVIERKDKSGDKYLCAFIVFKPLLEESEREKRSAIVGVRDFLAGKLPDYMIPVHFVPLESIPLTPSGKVDRKALPTTEPGVGSEYTAPRDQVEERLAQIWSEILGISKNKIGIDNNFFQLGGQSLKLVMLIAQIHKEFDVIAPMSKFFEIFSIRSQAQYIKNASPDKYTSIEAVEKKDYYPMSSAQKRMYILQRINPENINYNMPLFTTLEGLLEKARLENAFWELIFRHESLRTSFHLVKNNPVQRVHDKVNFEIGYYEGNAKKEIIKNFVRPFDLSQPSFLRVGLIKTGEESHILLVDMHHAVSDGNSLDIFMEELMALYQGKKLPDLRMQYKDYSEWLGKPVILEEKQKQEAYWLNRLAGSLPALKLPTDYPRPQERSFAGALVTFEIPRDTGEKLRALAKREDATMFMVIFTIFNILLFKLSHQEDIIVGTLVAGRRRSELQNIIGMFVNTLALRNYPQNEKTFKEFLMEVKTRTLEAFDQQEYPFDDLVEKLGVRREATRNPLFDVLFLFNSLSANEENKLEIPGLKIKPLEEKTFQVKFDLLFTGKDSGEKENLFFAIEYSTELFTKEKIERFISYFKEVITIVEKNESVALIDIGIEHDLASAASDFYGKVESDFEF